MATITPTVTYNPQGCQNSVLVTWANLANGDVGAPFMGLEYTDRTVQVSGNFGTTVTLTMQGSNDNSNWDSLTDPQANAIAKTAQGIEAILEAPIYIRPSAGGGSGGAINVLMVCKRNR
jgi:hypothetical protein